MSRNVVGTAVLALVLTACTPVPPRPSVPPEPSATSGPASATAPATSPAATSTRGPRTIATGLDVPWDMARLPDGSTLVTLRDRAELVRLPPTGEPEVVARVDGVVPGGEGGLLGIALSPSYDADARLYLYYTGTDDNRVVSYRYTGDTLTDPVTILTGIPKAGNHNGGRLRFGPDGNLYVGTGDAGRPGLAQDRSSLGGKILRVAPDGSVPAGNPFGNPVYSYGHRNVQGLGWDGSGRLFASEFGQDTWDELNLVRAGGNHGWPETEGATGAAGVVSPVAVWRTAEASPSGIAVAGDGTVYVAALRGERVWAVTVAADGTARTRVFLDGYGRVRDVAAAGDELWVLTNNTARGTPRPGDDRLVAVPLG